MPTKPSQAEYERVASLRESLRRFLRATDEVTHANGLTPQRYDLLVIVRGGTGAAPTVTEIAERLSLERHSVTELVGRTEQAGLVQRLPDPRDGRLTRVSLTRLGEERLAATMVALRPQRRRLLDLLGTGPKRG